MPQCEPFGAVTLSDSWRKPNSINGMKNTDTKILDKHRTWFRFEGGQLSNTCPHPPLTCGSTNSYWTPTPMPTKVGETRIFYLNRINAKNSFQKYLSCNPPSKYAVEGRVTRCSDAPSDLVYRIEGQLDDNANDGASICSMDVQ